MSCKGNIKFRFTQSLSGCISGIAFEEDGDIVASFKLEVGGGSIYMHGKFWNSVTLTMVYEAPGEKVYHLFDGILSKYGKRDPRHQISRIGRIRSRWRIPDDRVKETIEEVKRTLEKRK